MHEVNGAVSLNLTAFWFVPFSLASAAEWSIFLNFDYLISHYLLLSIILSQIVIFSDI